MSRQGSNPARMRHRRPIQQRAIRTSFNIAIRNLYIEYDSVFIRYFSITANNQRDRMFASLLALTAMQGLRDNVIVQLRTNYICQLSRPSQSRKMAKTPVRVDTLAFNFCVHSCIQQQKKHIPGQQNLYTLEHNPQRLNGNHLKAEFLDINGTKVLRVFLLAIHSHLYKLILLSPSPRAKVI